jgi:hypothetical protein
VQTRSGHTVAVDVVPDVSHFLLAPWLVTLAPSAARVEQWHRRGQNVAALYASNGGLADGPGMKPERGTALPGSAVAPATDDMGAVKPDNGEPEGVRYTCEQARKAERRPEMLIGELTTGCFTRRRRLGPVPSHYSYTIGPRQGIKERLFGDFLVEGSWVLGCLCIRTLQCHSALPVV